MDKIEKHEKELKEKQLKELIEQLNEYIIKNYRGDVSHIIINKLKIKSLALEDHFRLELRLPLWNIQHYDNLYHKLEDDNIRAIEDIFFILSDNVFPKIERKLKEKEEKIKELEKELLEVSKFLADVWYKSCTLNHNIMYEEIEEYWKNKEQELHKELKTLKGEK